MKKIANLLLAMLLTAAIATAQTAEKGIVFQHEGWQKILAQAQQKNQIIVVDAYTTWCGPCKWMAANVFTNDTVAAFYNKNFLCVKLDMEQGEGLKFAETYSVRAYPTYLFINGEGKVLHQAAGSMPAQKFIALGETALNPATQMRTRDLAYEKGNRDPQFLYDMAFAKADAAAPYATYADAYLLAQPDWTTAMAQRVIFELIDDPDNKGFRYLIDHRKEFEATYGERKVATKVAEGIGAQVTTTVQNDPKNGWEKAEKIYKQYFGKNAGEMLASFKVEFYTKQGNQLKSMEAMGDYIDKYVGDNWEKLNEAAWAFYENTDDKKLLKKALGWAKKSVKINPNFYNNDTLAALYYKLKDKTNAKAAAETAIQAAKKFGNDSSETKALLEKINKM